MTLTFSEQVTIKLLIKEDLKRLHKILTESENQVLIDLVTELIKESNSILTKLIV